MEKDKDTIQYLEHEQYEDHIAKAWDFFNNVLKKPRFICAPMVEQSELPFRLLTRRYGANLCYTPMLHSRIMVEDKTYKKLNFETCPEDRPLTVQFCGNDPNTILEAAKMVEEECDAVDINLGCPQGIARKGHYGSFLLGEPDLICKMVTNLNKNLKVPVTCKVRILPKEEDTISLCKRIERAGCYLLTVHGRTKEQNKDTVGTCDWEIIKKIKSILRIPVFANGGIFNMDDVQKCLSFTGVDGVMSSEALLENPALFSGVVFDLDSLAKEYLQLAKQYKTEASCVRAHLFKILHNGFQEHTDLREKLSLALHYEVFEEICGELAARRKDIPRENKFGWYHRHWNPVKKENVVEQLEDFSWGGLFSNE